MKKIFVIIIIAIPLAVSGIFITNNILSENFPLRPDVRSESEYIQKTYEAGLEYCEKNYEMSSAFDKRQEYDECVKLVNNWNDSNPER